MPAAVFNNRELMRNPRVFSPLNIAAYITWAAVAFDTLDLDRPAQRTTLLDALEAGDPAHWMGVAALFGFLALFVWAATMRNSRDTNRNRAAALALLQGGCALTAQALLGEGAIVILLILVAAQLAASLRPMAALAAMFALNLGFVALWYAPGGLPRLLLQILPIIGFQIFAALTAHYAFSAERSRDELLRVNAELLATRALLDESARSEERLRLSRELHDVAGHSLTALKLNLGAALRDPKLQDREDLRIASQLADELLAQIREVVSALRAHDGLDLRAALTASAQLLPGSRIAVEVEDGLRVDDLDTAETLLRCAQEAITNALRHGRANRILVRLARTETGALELRIENDGLAAQPIRDGNGITGMRERLAAIGGELTIDATPRGVEVLARIPERHA
jgi:signal transduction histidine kinase